MFQDEQLWKIESNGAGLYDLYDKARLKHLYMANLPEPGKDGFMTMVGSTCSGPTVQVLGVSNDATEFGAQVKVENTADNDIGQVWHRGLEDEKGYFTFENPHSGLFLTMNNESKRLEIEGDSLFYI